MSQIQALLKGRTSSCVPRERPDCRAQEALEVSVRMRVLKILVQKKKKKKDTGSLQPCAWVKRCLGGPVAAQSDSFTFPVCGVTWELQAEMWELSFLCRVEATTVWQPLYQASTGDRNQVPVREEPQRWRPFVALERGRGCGCRWLTAS